MSSNPCLLHHAPGIQVHCGRQCTVPTVEARQSRLSAVPSMMFNVMSTLNQTFCMNQDSATLKFCNEYAYQSRRNGLLPCNGYDTIHANSSLPDARLCMCV